MEQDPTQPKLKSWLDGLQQESWQLELVISGFAVFLLFAGLAAYDELEYDLVLLKQSSEVFARFDGLYYGLRIGILALLGCLLIHIALRGLWIAAVGLRSVSGDIDYERFRFPARYLDRLQRKTPSFDDYIIRLERYCSILFSFAFLLLFSTIGFVIFITFINALFYIVIFVTGSYDSWMDWPVMIIGLTIGLSYLIDFVTFGWLKRVAWLRPFYYPIYIFMGWLTLAFISRPLYYNLVDNRFGRRFALAIPVIIVLLLFINSWKYESTAYYPAFLQRGQLIIANNNYDDIATDPERLAWRHSLSSRYVRDNYLEVFVPYIPINDDEYFATLEPDVVPARQPGAYLKGPITIGEHLNYDADNEALLAAFDRKYNLYLNDSLSAAPPRFYFHDQRQQYGLLYSVPVHDLPVGEHLVRLDRRKFLIDTVAYSRGYELIFYK